MNIDFVLPTPTENELNLGYKSDYYERLIPMDLDKKYKITESELYQWIHHNYSSVFLTNEELPLSKFRKLKL
jgi:hypothetical protein